MTAIAWELDFIALWRQGVTAAAIAERLDIPEGKVGHASVQWGSIGISCAAPTRGGRRG